jgi:hypothetical protein
MAFVLALVLWTAGFPPAARATTGLPALSGPVVLTVTGLDPAVFPGGVVEFDIARLRALGETRLQTSTIWTGSEHVFTGVLLKGLLDWLELTDGLVRAVALNDYSVDIPVSDAVEDGPIMAYAIDDVPMTVREKGPLWIVYPFDANPEYRSEVIYTRSIWQLVRFEVHR